MAKTFDINEFENEEVSLIATIGQKDYAYSLLRGSNYDEEMEEQLDNELSLPDLEVKRLDAIIHDLKMNQGDAPNPSNKEIKRQLDERLARDK